ncbi:hypothetical protein [Litorihabitans aurantiacus]|uniref:hypothetical protein n=1 Tax=Litorihabitans aurantiacus TaxID=1930061 RepID=UPI0024E0E59D|nr:hypothetical protein [Litorihabitans aurantiacus]
MTSLSPRVVVVAGLLTGTSHAAAVAGLDALKGMVRTVDTVLEVETPAGAKRAVVRRDGQVLTTWHSERQVTVSLQMIAHDPRIFGQERRHFLQTGGAAGAFEYPVMYPITYGTAEIAQNTAVLVNDGNEAAHPVVSVRGDFPSGFRLTSGDSELTYSAPVFAGTPVVVDFLSRTVTQSGGLRTVHLTRRDFWEVPAGGSASITLIPISAGYGWAEAVVTDTYL